MTIIVPEKFVAHRGITNDLDIAALPTISTLVLDTISLSHTGLTLDANGRVQVLSGGTGDWIVQGNVSIENYSGSSRTSVLVGLLYNSLEIPGTRRYAYCRAVDHGSSVSFTARLTNLNVGDRISIRATRVAGAGPVRLHLYGAALKMERTVPA